MRAPTRLLLLASVVLAAMASAPAARNVLGGALRACCAGPKTTGYYRDGLCRTGPSDTGRHVVCAAVTAEFLAFTASRGNDLATAHPPHFPGLVPGDKWCLCALRWREALDAGLAPPVDLAATAEAALKYVQLEDLLRHALPEEGGGAAAGKVTASVSGAGAVAM